MLPKLARQAILDAPGFEAIAIEPRVSLLRISPMAVLPPKTMHAILSGARRGSHLGGLFATGTLVAAVLIAYSGTFGYPFLFDGLNLEKNLRQVVMSNPSGWLLIRPRLFGFLSFDLQYTLHGHWLPGFHAGNVAIHAAAAWVLMAIVRETLSRACPTWPARSRSMVAFYSAALWALHPLQTHSVTYLYQRFESLMGLLFLGAIWFLLRATRQTARPGPWLAASYACFLASLATKEVAVMAPLVLVLFDRAYLAATWSEILKRRRAYYAGLIGTVAGGLAYVVANWSHYVAGGLLVAERVSVWQYLRTQPEVVGHYVRQAVWPDGLSIDPAWPVQDDLLRLMVAWLAVAVSAIITAWLWRTEKRLAFLPLAFALILVPTSSIAPVIDLAFEHRIYLSLAPAAVAVTLGVRALVQRAVVAGGGNDSAAGWGSTSLLALTAIALAVSTAARNRVHSGPIALWGDAVQKCPHNTRAWANLGTALEIAGDPRATECYAEIVRLYRAAAGREPHPLADRVRRTPITIEFIWYGFARLAMASAAAGDVTEARRLYAEIEALPFLPEGGLESPQIKCVQERLQGMQMPQP